METLAPRDLYDDDELGMTRKLPLASGIFFGGWMGLFTLADAWGGEGTAGGAVLHALLVGVFSGALFGWMFPWLIGGMARRAMNRWYAGDPAVVAPPADGYPYRLPCGMLGASNRVVSGVLNLGPRGLRFDPLLRTPPALRESLIVEPLRDVQLDLVQTPVPRWLWMWGRRTLPRIRVRWPGGEALFGIPDAAGVLATLQNRVRALNDASASGG
ncbi:MAG TPA: hypothetical protein VFT45_19825 [Longimicrobium sp.]|nr:hypothetical protein [Longimicrobium sp.]